MKRARKLEARHTLRLKKARKLEARHTRRRVFFGILRSCGSFQRISGFAAKAILSSLRLSRFFSSGGVSGGFLLGSAFSGVRGSLLASCVCPAACSCQKPHWHLALWQSNGKAEPSPHLKKRDEMGMSLWGSKGRQRGDVKVLTK